MSVAEFRVNDRVPPANIVDIQTSKDWPTLMSLADKFVSWEDSTDHGTLEKTYDDNGKYVYGVALTVGNNGHGLGLSDHLLVHAAPKLISGNKKYIYFSGRMPGFCKYKNKMKPGDYYNATTIIKDKKVALDPQIRMYESFGLKKVRLVKDGFVGDKESANYGVVFKANNPLYNWPLPKLLGKIFGLLARNRTLLRLMIG